MDVRPSVEDIERSIASYRDPNSKLNEQTERLLKVASQEVIAEYQVSCINRILQKSQKSPFWRKKLNGINKIEELKDLERIPPTSRDEIDRLSLEGKWSDMLASNQCITQTFTTGGTTHKAQFVSAMSEAEHSCHVADVMRIFFDNCVKRSDTMINTFPGKYMTPGWVLQLTKDMGKDLGKYESGHISGTIFHQAAKRYGMNVVSTSLPLLAFKKSTDIAKQEADRIIEIYKKARAAVLATSPNLLAYAIIPAMEREGLAFHDLGTRIIILGGQTVPLALLKLIEARGVHVVSWLESGEVCTIAYTDRERYGDNFVGLIPTYFSTYFEIVDDEGNQLPFGNKGRVLATRLIASTQPLIRYDMEDESSFVSHRGKILFDREYTKSSRKMPWQTPTFFADNR